MAQAEKKIVPSQRTGASTGVSQRKECPTRHEAILLFNDAKRRLLDVNRWQELCGKGSAQFQLTDEKGEPVVSDKAQLGQFIRINLPAPPNQTGGGYDWVKIEAFVNNKDLIKDEDVFGFRVRPIPDPRNNEPVSAHFYGPEASSTFLITRYTNKVTAIEKGRNEVPNTAPKRLFNKIRNVAVALGAMIGLSTPQWKSLVTGILNGAPDED